MVSLEFSAADPGLSKTYLPSKIYFFTIHYFTTRQIYKETFVIAIHGC